MSRTEKLPSFFVGNDLSKADLELCLRFVAAHFADHDIQPLREQGGCSYTLKVLSTAAGSDHLDGAVTTSIVQLRLQEHAVPVPIAATACQMYAPWAPSIRELGQVLVGNGLRLQAVSMSSMPGQRFSDLQPRTSTLDEATMERMLTFVRSFGAFFVRQWSTGETHRPTLSGCPGTVGSTILPRLRMLERDLPMAALRRRARWVHREVEAGMLDRLPVVLTHGDLLPSNIMVDPGLWEVTGYVDWAEAEWLPYGVSLYGLDRVLGDLVEGVGTGKPRFVYYSQADELREAFWDVIEQHTPPLASEAFRAAVVVARDLGVLLWHGIAWDDGRIDRVINAAADAHELEYLQAFLGLRSDSARHDSVVGSSRPYLMFC